MKKIKLKQGTLEWEKVRSTRIGGSEVFDIVRYYAKDEELQNCGINPEAFKNEKPYTTVWLLYHKLKNDGVYKKATLAPEFAEYGHAAEPYGVYYLQKNRHNKLRPGEVYINNELVASLDVSGVAEEIDERKKFDYGSGHPKAGQKFVCEQKTMLPTIVKKGVPFKYIVQAQYQISLTKSDFFILQIMVLNEDTPFIRGKVTQMCKKSRFKYLDDNMKVTNLYFQNNQALSVLIQLCIDRFFEAVKNNEEPQPYIELDTQKNIIESIRLNSDYNDDAIIPFDLSTYIESKKQEEAFGAKRLEELQKIINCAKKNNTCNFVSYDGTTGKFSKSGAFLVKEATKND